MEVPISTLSLHGWADIAQFVIAIAGALALIGAPAQVRHSRTNARRTRVYEYADRVNEAAILPASADFTTYWATHSYEDYKSLDLVQQLEGRMLPNLIEEIAFLYNRRLLDRNVAAEILGIYVERLWTVGLPLTLGLRQDRRPDVYAEWEEMKRDTPRRQRRGVRRAERRRARRKFFHRG